MLENSIMTDKWKHSPGLLVFIFYFTLLFWTHFCTDLACQAVVIDEVDAFIFRPHIGLRAKYQAVCLICTVLLLA